MRRFGVVGLMLRAGEAKPRTALGLFFVVALAGAWLLQLPAVLARRGVLSAHVEQYLPLAALGGFSPVVGALVAAYREGGRRAIRQLFGASRSSPSSGWYLAALALFPLIYVVGAALSRLLFRSASVDWFYPPRTTEHVAALLIVPLAEEPGWRGYALPRLQARWGALGASALLGAAWAAWHVMMFLFPGPTLFGFTLAMLNIVCASFVFTWLFNRTQGSLPCAILAHAGAHLNNPGRAQLGNDAPMRLYTVAIALSATLLFALDRSAWQRAEKLGRNGKPSTP